MNRILPIIALGLSLLSGCGSVNPDKTEFKGTWTHILENGITGAKSEESVAVTVKGTKFRQVFQSPESESTRVFDGKTRYTKTTFVESRPIETSEAANDEQTYNDRFWSKDITHGGGQAGGTIGGRQALFFKMQDKRPDGEFTQQVWLDAKTRVMLKSILTVYSTQVGSIVTQETWECKNVDYTPADEGSFVKP